MYLVTGAGGGVGSVSRRVVELLLDDGEHVRAMVHRDDDRADQLRALGAEVVGGTPDAFGKFMQDEDKKWGDLAKRADLRIKEK